MQLGLLGTNMQEAAGLGNWAGVHRCSPKIVVGIGLTRLAESSSFKHKIPAFANCQIASACHTEYSSQSPGLPLAVHCTQVLHLHCI